VPSFDSTAGHIFSCCFISLTPPTPMLIMAPTLGSPRLRQGGFSDPQVRRPPLFPSSSNVVAYTAQHGYTDGAALGPEPGCISIQSDLHGEHYMESRHKGTSNSRMWPIKLFKLVRLNLSYNLALERLKMSGIGCTIGLYRRAQAFAA
jgi:hypothetical protein